MITPINQYQPHFKAKLNSSDISILTNEAKRSKAPQLAMNELSIMLNFMDVLPEKVASLVYKSENPASKFNLFLDGKKAAFSAVNFTEALKNLSIKRLDTESLNRMKDFKYTQASSDSLHKFAIDV